MQTFPTVCAAALVVAVSALAQTGPPASAKIDVKVINVDVAALDGGGQPVTDLTRDDFEVFEDDQPQKLTNFSAIDVTGKAAVAAAMHDVQLRRRLILLVDNNYIEKRERNQALT